MTRPGRVEVYRSTRLQPRWEDCPDASCDDPMHAPNGQHLASLTARGWRWRFRAPNGAIISAGSEGYDRIRDAVRGLELAFPGYRLLDQDCELTGPTWFLHGMEFAHPHCGADIAIPEDLIIGVGMRGVRIPVTVPAGVNLRSRR